jgi:hypothetical protein
MSFFQSQKGGVWGITGRSIGVDLKGATSRLPFVSEHKHKQDLNSHCYTPVRRDLNEARSVNYASIQCRFGAGEYQGVWSNFSPTIFTCPRCGFKHPRNQTDLLSKRVEDTTTLAM